MMNCPLKITERVVSHKNVDAAMTQQCGGSEAHHKLHLSQHSLRGLCTSHMLKREQHTHRFIFLGLSA